jgi:DNA-binding ferritin-like protein (Dps family)
MIEQLLELIKITNSKGEYSQIATGKNKIPETFKEAYQQIKDGYYEY